MKKGLKSPPNDTVDNFPFTSLGSSNYQPEDHCQTPHFNNASTTSDTLGSADPRINQFRRPRAYGNLYNSLVAREWILTSYTQEKISKNMALDLVASGSAMMSLKKQDESSYTDAIPRSISLNTLFLKKKRCLAPQYLVILDLYEFINYALCLPLFTRENTARMPGQGNNTPFRIVASRK